VPAVGTGRTVTAGTTLGGADAANYRLPATATTTAAITRRTLTAGFTTTSKTYDGTTAATIATRSVATKVGTEDVGLDGGTATFEDPDVGTGKAVAATGFTLSGADAGNYRLGSTSATSTGTITRKAVDVGIAAADKTYDRSRAATLTSGPTLSGVRPGDDVEVEVGPAGATFADATAGTHDVTAPLVVAGAQAGNYTVPTSATDRAEITAKAVSAAFTVTTRRYDGTTAAGIASSSLSGVLEPDAVTLADGTAAFASPAAGEDKDVTSSGFAIEGADAGNYALTDSSPTSSGTITKAPLGAAFTAADKVYDGTTDAVVDGTSVVEDDLFGSDAPVLAVASAAFAGPGVGRDKDVTGSGFILTGPGAGNYAVVTPVAKATADITKAALTVAFTAASKTYDGTTDATITGAEITGGKVGDDDVALGTGTGTFATKHAGSARTVTATFPLTGDDAGNYDADVTPTTADIGRKTLTPAFTAADKTYDGSTAAAISGRSATGEVTGESVDDLVEGGTATFDTKDVSTGKTVTGSGFTLPATVTDYALATGEVTTMADVRAKAIRGSFTVADKVYDATRAATITGRSLDAADRVDGDTVTLTGGTAAFDTAGAGTAKAVSATGFGLGGGDAGNYALATPLPDASAAISKAPLAIDADDATRQFGTAGGALTGTLRGLLGGDTRASATSGAPACSESGTNTDVGTYQDVLTCAVGTLEAANYRPEAGRPGDLTITQADTTLVYDGATGGQFSDRPALSAVLRSNGTPLAGRTVSFRLGTQDAVTATTDSGGRASVATQAIALGASTPNVVSTYAGSGNFAGSTDTDGFTVSREDARTTYNGGTFASTGSATSTTATATLSAQVQDITALTGDPAHDAHAGDIRKARVEFFDADRAGQPTLCTAEVGLVSSADPRTGVAGCQATLSTGSQDAASYTIGTRVVGDFYTRNAASDLTVYTVSKALASSFITGGGFLLNPSTTGGQVGAAPGRRTNFGFNVKYNKSGTNLQGQINTIIRTTEGRTVQVKGNAMTSLSAQTAKAPATAVFEGKASIQDVTVPAAPVSLGGNATLRVTMTDPGEPGTSDRIGITVFTGSGALFFSSSFSGGATVEQLLAGGNLVVR
jgi:trimeric autotransporter adhesin